MPKTNLCQIVVDNRELEVKAIIAAGMKRKSLLQAGLAKKVRMPASTLSARLRNPREMRIGELWDILDALETEEADSIKVMMKEVKK